MVLKIEWTDFSKEELYKIFDYHKNKASIKVAKKLILGIRNETLILTSTPKIGQKEILLNQSEKEYRYLVFRKYKIIYRVDYSLGVVIITDVFDTRQNPIKISRNK